MSKIKISTISLSSKNMKDIRDQIDNVLKNDETGERFYEVGPYYEPAPGYVGVDISIYMDSSLVLKYKALSQFEDEEEEGTIH